MTSHGKHQNKHWWKLQREHKPKLMAQLPQPCARCGQPMERGMKLDLSHISRDPQVTYNPAFLRLEHQKCNRRAGQLITAAKRKRPNAGARLGKW
jgi:hypothetical protein